MLPITMTRQSATLTALRGESPLSGLSRLDACQTIEGFAYANQTPKHVWACPSAT